MISDLVRSPLYWGVMVLFLIVFSFFLKAKTLDFKWFVALSLSQSIAHQFYLLQYFSSLLIWSIAFSLTFVIGYFFICGRNSYLGSRPVFDVVAISAKLRKYYYVYLCILVTILIYRSQTVGMFGLLAGTDVDRLDARLENKYVNYLFSVLMPLSSLFFLAVLFKAANKWSLLFGLFATIFILLTTGSKASILPFALSGIGVMSCIGRPVKLKVYLWMALLILFLPFLVMPIFPELEYADVGGLIIHRLVGNTDYLEYLYLVQKQPSDFPFAGFLQLFDPFVKVLGGKGLEYGAGVWLHGTLFDDWRGFGPNPGFAIEFNAAIGYFAIIFAFLFGIGLRLIERLPLPYSVVYLSVFPKIFVDVSLFWIYAGSVFLFFIGMWMIDVFLRFFRQVMSATRVNSVAS